MPNGNSCIGKDLLTTPESNMKKVFGKTIHFQIKWVALY
jgi:hypothetical protein